MNATATQTPKLDRDLAVQCLVAMHEITSNLLRMAAQGKSWSKIDRRAALKLTDIAVDFIGSCGLEFRNYEASDLPHQATRCYRVLGELHLAVASLLVHSAKQNVRPDLFNALDADYELRRVYELAVEFVATIDTTAT